MSSRKGLWALPLAVGVATMVASLPAPHPSPPAPSVALSSTPMRPAQPSPSEPTTTSTSTTTLTSTTAPPPPSDEHAAPARASRNAPRRPAAAPSQATQVGGLRVRVTAYCLTSRTADPASPHPYRGSAAGNRWPFGTVLHLTGDGYDLTVVVNDRIGHGADVDVAMPGDCSGAVRFGAHTMTVA